MAITQVSDIFDPQVVGDIVTDILFKRARLINSPAVVNATPQIYQDGGNTVTFPYWDTATAGIVQDQVDTRTGVTPSKITMGTYTEEVNDKIISFDVNKKVFQDISSNADPNSHIAELVAKESRQVVQLDLINKAEASPLVLETPYESGTAALQTLNVDAILEAKMVWGEYSDDGIPMVFAHSKQLTDLGKTDDFKTLGTATVNNAIVNAAAAQGAFAMVHGVLLMSLDSITKKGGTISEITRASQVATVTFAAGHNFKVGDTIVISGATQADYNGTFEVASVPTATTLTYTVPGSPATPATGTPVAATRYESLMCLPGAMGMVPKQGMENKVVYHAGSPVMTIDWDFRWVSTLFRTNPRKIVRLATR